MSRDHVRTRTRSQLQTEHQFPTLDSYCEGMKKNADGSIDVYFAPKPPKGQESKLKEKGNDREKHTGTATSSYRRSGR